MTEHTQHTAQKVLGVIKGMETNHVGAEQAFEQVAAPLAQKDKQKARELLSEAYAIISELVDTNTSPGRVSCTTCRSRVKFVSMSP